MSKFNETYKKLLKDTGLKITKARLSILKILDSCKKPCSVENIQKELKEVDVLTIYRTMNTFVEKGIVRKVHICGEQNFFELTALPHHHHIICRKCGVVEDFDDCNLIQVIEEVQAKSRKFNKIDEHSFELFGICDKCN